MSPRSTAHARDGLHGHRHRWFEDEIEEEQPKGEGEEDEHEDENQLEGRANDASHSRYEGCSPDRTSEFVECQ